MLHGTEGWITCRQEDIVYINEQHGPLITEGMEYTILYKTFPFLRLVRHALALTRPLLGACRW